MEAELIEVCARPGADRRAAEAALRQLLPCLRQNGDRTSEQLVWLAHHYGNQPFTPLEQARQALGMDRAAFRELLRLFAGVPELRTAVEQGPSGKYWTNTILPMERAGVMETTLTGKPSFPYLVGLYPGPTCMFRCHFCIRVTGARYGQSALEGGNEMFASVIDGVPPDNPFAMYFSGGLEPLTNPGLGALVSRAASRGFKISMYTNSFALTEQTLARQPGLWNLYALRTSLYGLDEEQYRVTTTKRNGYERVKKNLIRFNKLRAERDAPIRMGLNYIVLPGAVWRLLDLVDYIAEINDVAPGRPLDFVTLREDYSGRPNGKLSDSERTEMGEALEAFEARVRGRMPMLNVDHGYALESLRMGADAELLRIRPDTMRPTAHPQVAVQIDLLGDVYLYREAGFPDLPGARRYIAGRVTPQTGVAEVVERFVSEHIEIEALDGDEYFLDGFDQVITARLNQLEADVANGWGELRGLLR